MSFDWKSVTRNHVLKAIDIFLEENPEYPEAKTTFLLYNGKKLPAKHIRGMAYKVANGVEISKQDFTGGKETVRFFERLGFEVDYIEKSDSKSSKKNIVPKNQNYKSSTNYVEPKPAETKQSTDIIKIPSKGVIEQKNALQLILNKLFDGDIVCEKTFPWMKTPETYEGYYKNIYDALHSYRGDTNFAKKNVSLRCDFVCESEKLIIEYDERQHFSKAREITLECYNDLPLCYDADLWMKACKDIEAKDNNPINRDEIRAYYDSVRDIEALNHGYRLIRIMHGQIDFEKGDAKEKIIELLDSCTTELPELKIGLYLQTTDKQNSEEFEKAMSIVKESDIDLLVFPEFAYVPFEEFLNESDIDKIEDIEEIFKKCMSLSEEINCAVIVGGFDAFGTIFSVYANADFVEKEETDCSLYIKHTATQFSAFDLDNYSGKAKFFFSPIYLKGYELGMTICNDCTHALFSSMYGVQGVDIIINCTGGNVVYDKWHKYTQSRAIENNCYTFTTMGGEPQSNSCVYGFSPSGKELTPKLICGNGTSLNVPGGIYVYSTEDDDGKGQIDRSINQNQSENKYIDFMLNSKDLDDILKVSVEIENNLYVYKYKEYNIVFVLTENEDILYPEKFLPLMYSDKLSKYTDKRYIIVNRFEELEKEFYENKLSVVLKVRAMENYCAVLLLSDLITMCYQTGKNKNAQVLKASSGCFGLDLSRMTGPETIWRNAGSNKKASWREGYTWLAKQCGFLSENGTWMQEL